MLLIVFAILALAGSKPAGAQTDTISINWAATVGKTTVLDFGSNDQFAGAPEASSEDPRFSERMAQMGMKNLSIQLALEQLSTTDAWDETRIARILNAPYVKQCGDANLKLMITGVPKSCRTSDGQINVPKYAALCAQLVKIVNGKMKRHVRYWICADEPNEWKDFHDPQQWPQLYAMYNACAIAMKSAVPGTPIKMIAGALSWPNRSLVRGILRNCWPNLDGFQWHAFFTGADNTNGDQGIYDKVMRDIPAICDAQTANVIAEVNACIKDGYPKKPIILANGSMNIPADWTLRGWDQNGYHGACFFAAALKHQISDFSKWPYPSIIESWSVKDNGVYGLISKGDTLTLPGYVYAWCNHHLIGTLAAVRTTSAPASNPDCDALAVYDLNDPAGKHNILLYNMAVTPRDVNLEFLHLPYAAPFTAHMETINAHGYSGPAPLKIAAKRTRLTLQPFTSCLIRLP